MIKMKQLGVQKGKLLMKMNIKTIVVAQRWVKILFEFLIKLRLSLGELKEEVKVRIEV